MKLKVSEGTQVNVDGRVYSEGQSFEPVDDRHAHQLLASGVAVDDSDEVERPSAAEPVADERTARRTDSKKVADAAQKIEGAQARTR